MYNEYKDDVQFLMVYIREAHAIDSTSPSSFLAIEDPIDFLERQEVCTACVDDLNIPIPAIIDHLDDRVNKAYAAHPDRMYLVGKNGKIAYAGARGPSGFKPDELEKAITRELSGEAPADPPAQQSAVGRGARPGGGPGFGGMRGGPAGRPDPAQMFRRMDADGDGRLSKEELPPGMRQRWQRMDTNGDGFVDRDEQSAIVERIRRFSRGGTERQ